MPNASIDFLHYGCLRPFGSLHDFKLDDIPFSQSPVAFSYDCRIVNEHVGAILPPNETEALRIIEPFYYSAHNSSFVKRASKTEVIGSF